jgi:hypothetical protein
MVEVRRGGLSVDRVMHDECRFVRRHLGTKARVKERRCSLNDTNSLNGGSLMLVGCSQLNDKLANSCKRNSCSGANNFVEGT